MWNYTDSSETGYLLYIHILPGHFTASARAYYGPETFSFVINQKRPVPGVGEQLRFARCGYLRAARVVSICTTTTQHLVQGVTVHDYTVNCIPVDGTVIDQATMEALLRRRGWRFLTAQGTIEAYH